MAVFLEVNSAHAQEIPPRKWRDYGGITSRFVAKWRDSRGRFLQNAKSCHGFGIIVTGFDGVVAG